MIKNYLKFAWRSIKKQQANSIVKIVGLSIGMVATIFITMWVKNEYSFDRYHNNVDRIFLLTSILNKNSETIGSNTPFPLGSEIKKQLPEIENFTRLRSFIELTIKNSDQLLKEKKAAYVDENWFDFFNYDFLEGSHQHFNDQPNSVILTKSTALKYFGNKQTAVGKILVIEDLPFTVQGVINDGPQNSSFQYNIYMPVAARHSDSFWKKRDNIDYINSYLTFIKSSKPISESNLVARIEGLLSEKWKKNYHLGLLPLKDLHFEERLGFVDMPRGNLEMTNVLLLIGILLLIVVCINYINLTTAKAIVRAKEVSIKKIIGAKRGQLFLQFITETLLVIFISVCLAIVLSWVMHSSLSSLSGLISPISIIDSSFWIISGSIAFMTLILASIYPAITTSSFKPIQTLRGNSQIQFNNTTLRKLLVIIQFVISIALIIATFVIHGQMRFINQSFERFNRSQLFSFIFPANGNMDKDEKKALLESIKQELERNSSITEAAIYAGTDVLNMQNQYDSFDWEGRDRNKSYSINFFPVGSTLNELYDLKLIAGRWFLPGSKDDEHNFIVNETTVQQLELQEPLIGRRLSLDEDTGKIVGVVKDFYYSSLKERISPMVFGNNPWYANSFIVKCALGRESDAIAISEKIFKRYLPGEAFDYRFVTDEFDQVYHEERQTSRLIMAFSVLAIFISCLGLYSLATFSVERRMKEIGIRKVMGASVSGIIALLSKEYLRLVLISFAIASPIAWWGAKKWLENFAYHISVDWWVFPLAGFTAIFIALLTVCSQAFKAAVSNPIDAIKEM